MTFPAVNDDSVLALFSTHLPHLASFGRIKGANRPGAGRHRDFGPRDLSITRHTFVEGSPARSGLRLVGPPRVRA